MLTHLPLAFSVNLQARAVQDKIQTAAAFLWQPHLQGLAASGKGRMIGHRQPNRQHGKHRTHKTLGLTIRQAEHFLDGQHDFNRLVAIVKLAAALFLAAIQPDLFNIIGQPECDRATLYQRFLVCRPVLYTV